MPLVLISLEGECFFRFVSPEENTTCIEAFSIIKYVESIYKSSCILGFSTLRRSLGLAFSLLFLFSRLFLSLALKILFISWNADPESFSLSLKNQNILPDIYSDNFHLQNNARE